MEKVTGVPGEHMTREQTLDGVEEIIGKADTGNAESAPAEDKKPEPAKDDQPSDEKSDPKEDDKNESESKDK